MTMFHQRLIQRLERRLAKLSRGVTAVEYGLLIFLISIVMVPVLVVVGPGIASTFQKGVGAIGAPAVGASAPAADLVASPLTDAWVPPSVAVSDGLAAPSLAIGGAAAPLIVGPLPDVYTRNPHGWLCYRTFTSWQWLDGKLVVQAGAAADGDSPGSCAPNGLARWTWGVTVDCVVTSGFQDAWGHWHDAGEVTSDVVTDGTSYGSDSTSFWMSDFGCQITGKGDPREVPWRISIPGNGGGSTSSDSLVTYVPNALVQTPIVTATTACSDGSTASATFASGAPVAAPVCSSGSLVSVTLKAGGQVVGTTTVQPSYVGNHCLDGVGICGLEATSGAQQCVTGGPAGSCDWLASGAAPEACSWMSGADMFASLQPSDCTAAKSLNLFPLPVSHG